MTLNFSFPLSLSFECWGYRCQPTLVPLVVSLAFNGWVISLGTQLFITVPLCHWSKLTVMAPHRIHYLDLQVCVCSEPAAPRAPGFGFYLTVNHWVTHLHAGELWQHLSFPAQSLQRSIFWLQGIPHLQRHPWDSLRIVKGALIVQGRARLWLSSLVYYQFAPGKAPWVLTPTCLTSSYQNAGSHVCVGTCSHSSQSWPRSHEQPLGNSDVMFSLKNPVSSKIRFRFFCSKNQAKSCRNEGYTQGPKLGLE